ncbi:hypothetical protein B0H13DRAFT_1895215 [Mycena leptocephala]|nr:hypothetical protein B0H13DRAFT_1895215 [Mycena leptocephala]
MSTCLHTQSTRAGKGKNGRKSAKEIRLRKHEMARGHQRAQRPRRCIRVLRHGGQERSERAREEHRHELLAGGLGCRCRPRVRGMHGHLSGGGSHGDTAAGGMVSGPEWRGKEPRGAWGWARRRAAVRGARVKVK